MESPATGRSYPALAVIAGVVALSSLWSAGCVDLSRPSTITAMKDAGPNDPSDPNQPDLPDPMTGEDAAVVPDAPDDPDPWEQPATTEVASEVTAETPTSPPLRMGPVAYWPLDEGVGNLIKDLTSNKNDGEGLNFPSWENIGLPSRLTGDRSAMRFDGNSNCASMGVVGIPANGSSSSFLLWFNVASAAPTQNFMTVTDGHSAALAIGLKSGVLAAWNWANTVTLVSTAAPPRDSWHHLAYTYHNGQSKLYLDGVLKATGNAVAPAAPTSEVWLASSRGRTQFLGGQLDDIRVYERALTDAEVAAQSAGAAAVLDSGSLPPVQAIPNIVGHWKMDETTTGGSLADSSGQSNHATTLNNPVPAEPVPDVTFPNPQSRAFFNNQCARFGNPPALNFAGVITLTAWVYPTVKTGIRQIIAHGPADSETGMRLDNGWYQIYSWNGTNHLAEFEIPGEDIARWVHLVGTYDGSIWRLYRNGRQVAIMVDRVGAVQVNGNWSLAAVNCNDRFFQGRLDDLRVYRRSLIPAEVRQLARGEP